VVDGFQKFAAGDSVKPRSVIQSAEAEKPQIKAQIVGSR
jgi:hypothetical protein